MKVRELIEQLQALPQDLDVSVASDPEVNRVNYVSRVAVEDGEAFIRVVSEYAFNMTDEQKAELDRLAVSFGQ